MELSLLVLLFIFTCLVGVWGFAKSPKKRTNYALGMFILLFAMSILHVFNVRFFFQTPYNPLILLPLNLVFLPCYFLILYFNNLLSTPIFNKKLERLLLIIGIIELSTNLIPFGAWIYTRQFDRNLIAFTFSIKRFFVLLLLPFGAYLLYMLRRKISSDIAHASNDSLKIAWIKKVILLVALLLIVIAIPEIAYFLKFQNFILFLLQCFIGAAIVTYIGITHLKLEKITVAPTEIKDNTPNSNFKTIVQLIETEKLYRNEALRISDIAEKVALSPNYVSKIINEQAQIRFNDLINQYRIEEVIEKIHRKEYLQKNIFALAQESGFKSKSTFQTVFKKMTGKTPTEFIKNPETP